MLVEKSVLVGYSAQQMFDLVDNVERYPEFLPWCGGASVDHHGEGVSHATVHIAYHHVKQSLTTRNTVTPPHRIAMELHDGPFSHLDGCWVFTALGDNACKVEFRLRYEFSSKLLEKLLGPVFQHVTNSFVDAFVRRAEKIYP